ncbi:outer membrane lipoprotein P61 [Sporocytophaga myxococcoides]|uniref:Outer membrane lipoprotein P61 n=1 Tax=Sporocytophaga myxococcoides TaxID=153721 RepID=A0A098LDI9_9BACT|nr:tetratricopeptide repeat protein [Sporocytophaga myxococcoides]GAL85026.1 outer membrane lipoprotein P61 [Sporocytophaga myxococcoides]
MKKVVYYFILLVSLGLLESCKNTEKKKFEGATVEVKPGLLEVHGDSIRFNAQVIIPENSGLEFKSEYYIVPEIAGYHLDTIAVDGVKCEVDVPTDADCTFIFSAPFHPDMMGKYMSARQYYFDKNADEYEFKTLENLAYCCLKSGELLSSDGYFLPLKSEKKEALKLIAQFNFPKNIYDLNAQSMEKSDYSTFRSFISDQQDISSIEIKGFASPEGKLERNELLAKERAIKLEQLVKDEIKATSPSLYEKIKNKIKVSIVAEDWEGLQQSIKHSDFSIDQKREIIDIAGSDLDSDLKEEEILKIAGGMDKLVPYLAPLRRTNIIVSGSHLTAEDTIAEASQTTAEMPVNQVFKEGEWIDQEAGNFNHKGKKTMFLAFYKIPQPDTFALDNSLNINSPEGKAKAENTREHYLAELEKNPHNHCMLNNLGLIYMKEGNYEEAIKYLKLSLQEKKSPEAHYNLGLAYAKLSEYEKALAEFKLAEEKLPEVKYNKGVVSLLLKDYPQAEKDLNSYTNTNPDDPNGFYALAVVGARTNNEEMVTENLQRACEDNPAYCEKAKTDLEFKDFINIAQFKTATAGKKKERF